MSEQKYKVLKAGFSPMGVMAKFSPNNETYSAKDLGLALPDDYKGTAEERKLAEAAIEQRARFYQRNGDIRAVRLAKETPKNHARLAPKPDVGVMAVSIQEEEPVAMTESDRDAIIAKSKVAR